MKYKNEIKIFLAGCAYSLAFPFVGTFTLFPLIFISAFFIHKTYSDKSKTFKRKIFENLLFLWGFNTVGFYWLNFTLFEFGGLTPPLNIFFWQLFTLIIGLHFFIFTIFDHYALRRFSGFLHIIIVSLLFPLFEYFIPQQFPAHFGHPWLVLAPFIKPAQFFGVPFFSFLSLLIGGCAFHFTQKKYINLPVVGAIFLCLIGLIAFPIKNNFENENIDIKIIQANIGNDLKLKSEQGIQLALDEVVETYKRLSIESVKTQTDLVIWPETAYPRVLGSKFNPSIPYELKSIIKELNSNLFIGTYDLAHMRQTNFEQQYNTAMLFSPDAQNSGIYYKRELIPFGEGLPFGSLNEYIAPYISNISFFAKGDKFTTFNVEDFQFISLICYEVLFPEYVRSYLNSSSNINFIVNLTNDSWYGPYAEQEQHLFLAKWRSVEFNLPLVRATNTGISTVVYPTGEEIARTKNFEQTYLTANINKFQNEPTLFQRFGILSYLVFVFIIITISYLRRKSFLK